MKVVLVSNVFPPSIGGIQTHVYELATAIALNGHKVIVVTRALRKPKKMDKSPVEFKIIWARLPSFRFLYNWKLRKLIKNIIRSGQCDVIHVHGMRPLKGCANLGVPLIFTNHTSSFLRRVERGGRSLRRMLPMLKNVDKVLAPSEELIEATKEAGYKGPTLYIPNGVDINKFSPGDSKLRQQLGIQDSDFVVVLARRLVDKNGTLFMAEAMKNLQHADIHLLVAGDGEHRKDFEAIIEKGFHPNNVHMLGFVSNVDMVSVYRAGDICVLPSLMEATSITGLEAMACGLPLVGTRVGGIPDLIEEGKTGLLVDPRSSQQIKAAIEKLYLNPELTHSMRMASTERARSMFAWEKIARQTVAAYSV